MVFPREPQVVSHHQKLGCTVPLVRKQRETNAHTRMAFSFVLQSRTPVQEMDLYSGWPFLCSTSLQKGSQILQQYVSWVILYSVERKMNMSHYNVPGMPTYSWTSLPWSPPSVDILHFLLFLYVAGDKLETFIPPDDRHLLPWSWVPCGSVIYLLEALKSNKTQTYKTYIWRFSVNRN